MSLADAIANALVEAAAALERNQADIDAVVARGESQATDDAVIALERERASLLKVRDALLIADAEVADSPAAH